MKICEGASVCVCVCVRESASVCVCVCVCVCGRISVVPFHGLPTFTDIPFHLRLHFYVCRAKPSLAALPPLTIWREQIYRRDLRVRVHVGTNTCVCLSTDPLCNDISLL